jgi:2-oxoglutarate ferredoxin oxidoreductase subunit gamma
MQHKCIFAGFGGQGILSMGQVTAYAGMEEGRQVSFYPWYAAAVRGGSANCTVVISSDRITSPIVCHPTVMVAMDEVSFDGFQACVAPGGWLFVNASLVNRKVTRTDVRVVLVNATGIALAAGDGRVANMVMLGAVLKQTGLVSLASVEKAMKKAFAPKLHPLIPRNLDAVKQGYQEVQ